MKINIEEQIAIAFWQAMAENEKNFQEFMASNPPPFERQSAEREYHYSRMENEKKFVEVMTSLPDGLGEDIPTHPDFLEGEEKKSYLVSKLREFRTRLFEGETEVEGITISIVRGDETLTFHIDHKTFEVIDCFDEYGETITPTNKEKNLAIELAKGGHDETGR